MKDRTKQLYNRLNSFDKRSSLVNIDGINHIWTGESGLNHSIILGNNLKSNRNYFNGILRDDKKYSTGHDEYYYNILNRVDNFNRPVERKIPDKLLREKDENNNLDLLV